MRRHTGFTITEIAEAAGFVSPSHFTRIFKAREGVSPSNRRKTQGGESSLS
ncbi:AraC family transcriptional regulator [uncultured Alistipes sp.]|uniref:AraC family transcriptional regulator n=1 Tax=uncultured Alistipes sp. TaxID=538949 RepID=UPI00260BFA38|nr:AraC family transcriptional regulator [uncultured Alistipes sp.]